MKAKYKDNDGITVVGILNKVERMPNSYNGNPRYLVSITSEYMGNTFLARTKPDASLGYSIDNHFGKKVSAILGSYYGHLSITNVEAVK
tara:strand:+ start:555 stop:821 length:267 start_codon:yes stop_codon:yes gene_type:complete